MGKMSGRTEAGNAGCDGSLLAIRRSASSGRSRPRTSSPISATASSTASVVAIAPAVSVDPSTRAIRASPPIATCQPPLTAVSRMSARMSSSAIEPCGSTTTETFGPSRRDRPARSAPVRIASTSGRGSARSERSRPARGEVSTGTPVRTGIASALTASAKSRADVSVRPRTWKLPRAVISTMPLPWI